MKYVVGRSNTALTFSAELRKILLLHRVAFLLSLPKREKFIFLTGLIHLVLCRVAQIEAAIEPNVEEPAASTILKTVCQPIVKTGPPCCKCTYRTNQYEQHKYSFVPVYCGEKQF